MLPNPDDMILIDRFSEAIFSMWFSNPVFVESSKNLQRFVSFNLPYKDGPQLSCVNIQDSVAALKKTIVRCAIFGKESTNPYAFNGLVTLRPELCPITYEVLHNQLLKIRPFVSARKNLWFDFELGPLESESDRLVAVCRIDF